jgi:hypothetical protein
VDILQDAFRKALKDQEFHRDFLNLVGEDPEPLMPEELARVVRDVSRDTDVTDLLKALSGAGPLPRADRARTPNRNSEENISPNRHRVQRDSFRLPLGDLSVSAVKLLRNNPKKYLRDRTENHISALLSCSAIVA